MSDKNTTKGASEEQLLYAVILEKGMFLGLALMVITFTIYMTGIMKPAIPVEQISNYWKMPVSAKASHGAKESHAAKEAVVAKEAGAPVTAEPAAEVKEHAPQPAYLDSINKDFLHREKPPTGWAWLSLIGYADFLNFIPVAMLAGVTIFCYAAIIPGLFRRKDTAYAVMAFAEVLILTLAASGLLAVGGH